MWHFRVASGRHASKKRLQLGTCPALAVQAANRIAVSKARLQVGQVTLKRSGAVSIKTGRKSCCATGNGTGRKFGRAWIAVTRTVRSSFADTASCIAAQGNREIFA